MSLILSGTDGLSDVDGSAATPAIRGTDANTGIFFPAADTIAFSEGGVESMRIDSAGNVGIGTNSPSALKLTVEGNGAQIRVRNTTTRYRSDYAIDNAGTSSLATYDDTGGVFKQMNVYASPLIFYTTSAGAETMRIDTSGNVLVGGTSNGGAILHAERSTSAVVGRFYNSMSSGFTSDLLQAIAVQGSSTACTLLGVYYNGGANFAFRVRGDGTIYAQDTTVQSASDARFKENIVDSSDGLNVISALRPVRFDLKEGNGVSAKTNQLGFIAQEVKPVFPDAVDVWKESDDPENPYLSMGTTALIPVLTKAIQEQQALIQSLTARITALESN